jgi:hypothetical protein
VKFNAAFNLYITHSILSLWSGQTSGKLFNILRNEITEFSAIYLILLWVKIKTMVKNNVDPETFLHSIPMLTMGNTTIQ